MAPTKLLPGVAPANGRAARELEGDAAVAGLREAISKAASEVRHAPRDDARQAARRAAIKIATAMLSANSADTASHSGDVDVISEGIARRLGFSGQQLDDIVVAARLHDIGKVGISARILEKPGPLDRREWKAIHRHTVMGEEILLSVPELRGTARLVRHSHERWDGRGYPDRLAGEEIPLGSRIIFCADAFHAIRSNRPYRQARTPAEALAEIRACAGSQFDPTVVEALEALTGELRRSGHRPRSRRAGRLMALMLIVSVGATGSALARSGLISNPKGPVPPPSASGRTSAAGGEQSSAIAAPVGAMPASDGSAVAPSNRVSSLALRFAVPGLGFSSKPLAGPGALSPIGAGAAALPTGFGAPAGANFGHSADPGQVGNPASTGSQATTPGIATGPGNGKTAKASSEGSASLGTSEANVSGKLKSAGSKKPKAKSTAAVGTPSSVSSATGKGSESGQSVPVPAPKLPKPPKVPKPPKPPKITPPLQAPGSASPFTSSSAGPSSSGAGAGVNAGGNPVPSGNGNAGGKGKGHA